MRIRPIGITIFAALFAINIAFYVVLATLAVFNRSALIGLLHALSPSGVGPAPLHTAMGRLLPVYYAAMAAVTVALAMGFWRLWNWTRIVVLAMIAISLVLMVKEVPLLVTAPTPGAIALTLVRVALSLLVGWYLFSRPVRHAFRHPQEKGSAA